MVGTLGRISALPAPVWVIVHVASYAVVTVIAWTGWYLVGDAPRSLQNYFLGLTIFLTWQFVLFAMFPTAVMVSILWLFRGLRPLWFRLIAVLLCCVPLVCNSDAGQLAFYGSLQLILGLLIRQPRR
jgi:hypothetical protein